mgnify:CR=1 FL=1
MLINTVVLFLRDTLPIFLLLSVLLALPGVSRLSLVWRIASLLVTAAMTYSYLGVISQLAEGAGFELLKSLLLVSAWIGICVLVICPFSKRNLQGLQFEPFLSEKVSGVIEQFLRANAP